MTRETYDWAVDTLLDAYNEGKLEHGNCAMCAVGNLLGSSRWRRDFITGSDCLQRDYRGIIYRNFYSRNYFKDLDVMYKNKGFSRTELMQIEYAFESSISHDYRRLAESNEGQFIGLTAVLKLIATMVDEPVEQPIITKNQERLTKIYEKVNV
jgi:hypothetical protein